MTWYKITNTERKVQMEFSSEMLEQCIEIATYRKPALAKELIELYENLEGMKYNKEKNKVRVRKC